MEQKELIELVYKHVDSRQIDSAVMACLRLARKTDDLFNVIIFSRELHPNQRQIKETFYEETKDLKPEAKEFLWKKTTESWIDERDLQYSLDPEREDRTVLALGVGELQADLINLEKSIADLTLPSGMGEFDTAAFTDRYLEKKSELRLRIKSTQTILERIRTRCMVYASRIEKQLSIQIDSAGFFSKVQNMVNNYFAVRSEPIYQKLQKVSELIESNDKEDCSLLLTSVRRAIKAVADHFYSPLADEVLCKDGIKRLMGEEQYLNRLQEFCANLFPSTVSGDLLCAEFDYIAIFVRRINDVASKGVHSDVTSEEAKQGVLGFYFFLYNIIGKLEHKDS